MEVNRTKKTITISQNTGITVSIALVLMFAGAIFTVATWTTDVRNITQRNKTDIVDLRNDVTQLKVDSTTSQVKFTEIQTQLKSIDATLLEIKERLN